MTDEYVDLDADDASMNGEYSRLRRRYEHYKTRYQRYKRIYVRSLVAAVSLGVVCAGLIALLVAAWMTRSQIQNENVVLLRQIASLESQLAKAESRLQVSGPLGLLAFEFDALLPVRDSYVKAIELKLPDSLSSTISFQLLLENTRLRDLTPDVSLELFDHSGSVMSTHRLDLRPAGRMRAGSTRTVSGTFIESEHAKVTFFRVKTK